MAHNDLFRTRDHVPDFDAYVARYREQSAETRARLECRQDVSYGESPGATLDLFFPGNVRSPPLHLFVHGGYWRMFDKSDFSFVADTVCAAGGIAAIMNYDLMPIVRMETIVAQVIQCASWLTANAGSFGGDAARFSVSGHSAGGHLACFLATPDSPARPTAILSLSGIYDLAPLQQSFLQTDLKLTADEVERFSPLSLDFTRSPPITLMVGEEETPPFHVQAEQLENKLLLERTVHRTTVARANHMSIASDLGVSNSIPAAP